MARVTGIGGVFFKAEDKEALYAWYEKYLGMVRKHGFVSFSWENEPGAEPGVTAWSLFAKTSNYFDPSTAPFMINYRVDDLDGILDAMKADGVAADPKREDSEYGRFAWVFDPEGNKIELWEPPKQ